MSKSMYIQCWEEESGFGVGGFAPISMLMPSPLEPCPTQNIPPLFVLGKHLPTSEDSACLFLWLILNMLSSFFLTYYRVAFLLHIKGAPFEVLPFLGQSGQWWQKWEWEVADWLHLPPNCSSLPIISSHSSPIISSHNCSIHLSPLNPPATQHSLFLPSLYLNFDLFSCSNRFNLREAIIN